ncbi:MAG TPA: hypothetical protein VHC22_16260 [Pirellulales bacterium]|nr:hypothetical protein [Pirellulales bacterium]
MNQLIEDFQNMTQEELVGLGMVVGMVALVCRLFKRKSKPVAPIDPLDYPLMQWVPGCWFTVRHLLANVLALGATGSAKTSGSGRQLMRAIVRLPTSGGLLLCSKPEDIDEIRAIFDRAGRLDDLIVVNADGELGFNYLDFAISLGADARDLTRWVMVPAETLRARESKGGGEMGDFWDRENERLIYNAVLVILLAKQRITISDIQQFIMTSLQNPQQVTSPEWQGCFHDKCMRAAFDAPKTPIQQHDFDIATAYLFREWPSMADKTKSSINTGVLGMLHCMNSGLARVLCSDKTNVSPAEMLRGRWIAINLRPRSTAIRGCSSIPCGSTPRRK